MKNFLFLKVGKKDIKLIHSVIRTRIPLLNT